MSLCETVFCTPNSNQLDSFIWHVKLFQNITEVIFGDTFGFFYNLLILNELKINRKWMTGKSCRNYSKYLVSYTRIEAFILILIYRASLWFVQGERKLMSRLCCVKTKIDRKKYIKGRASVFIFLLGNYKYDVINDFFSRTFFGAFMKI